MQADRNKMEARTPTPADPAGAGRRLARHPGGLLGCARPAVASWYGTGPATGTGVGPDSTVSPAGASGYLRGMTLQPDVVRLARGANLATVVTLMADGQPQAQLRWIDTDGEHLLVNTEPQRQAARNVERDPRVSILIHVADNPYDWAEVRGRVVETIRGDEARRHIDAVAHKYTGGDYAMPIGPEGRVLWRVAAERQITSGAGAGAGSRD